MCLLRSTPTVSKQRKQHLSQKTCALCQRPFAWRKKWARCWDEVRYCSERCRRTAKQQSTSGRQGYEPHR
ncbi:DUF2256 domain-containing protein [Halomonas sp. MC140]|nr:DUF2256 domain-containing protein [Halomonas sp. MC140]MDN7132767.1 DUF2256 domain-containing protein [Halomonas sp. MC140]